MNMVLIYKQLNCLFCCFHCILQNAFIIPLLKIHNVTCKTLYPLLCRFPLCCLGSSGPWGKTPQDLWAPEHWQWFLWLLWALGWDQINLPGTFHGCLIGLRSMKYRSIDRSALLGSLHARSCV